MKTDRLTLKKGIREKTDRLLFWGGLLAVLVTLVPGLLLGEDAVFTYHDQLDGEVIAYCLQARHLFSGDVLPEFMGGASKTALTLPAPACVLLFLTGNACFALTAMLFMGRFFGYLGMYLLAKEVTEDAWAATAAGVLFGWLPFLPVYGLSQFGIPLLVWCALQLKKGKRRPEAYLYTAFFALNSSLVLAGFGLLGMGVLWLVWCFWKHREAFCRTLAAWLLLLGIYIVENGRLLAGLLGIGESFVSHKTEYTLTANSFWGLLVQYLTSGGQHSGDYHLLPAAFALAALAAGLVRRNARAGKPVETSRKTAGTGEPSGKTGRLAASMGVCLGWNVLFAFAAAFWNAGAGIRLRERLSVLGAFQLDRLLWIAPCFWYLLFACGIAMARELATGQPAMTGKSAAGEEPAGGRRSPAGRTKALGAFALALAAAAGLAAGAEILLSGDVKSNVQKLRNPEYGVLSFREYYAIGVMDQVEAYLRETTGQEPEEYRVVSLGIDPAAALYQGFYCLDGYSNNYSLEYKHAFRRILAPELDRSEYLREYFDGWGNRCYLFSSECPGYYTIEKNGFYFSDYRPDTEALRELGGDYLFSAAYIANAGEQGLTLLREEPFETEDSYYRIFVYEVSGR